MKYYYDYTVIDEEIYDDTARLKDEIDHSLTAKLASQIKIQIPNINYYWTRKNTFGFVFTTYEHTSGKVIGKGEKALYEQIKNIFQFVILSHGIKGKFRPINIGENHGIMINVTYFRYIFQKVGDANKIVELFLSKPEFDEIEEETLKKIFKENPDKLQDLIDIDTTVDFIRKHAIENPTDLNKIMKLLTDLSHNHELDNPDDLMKLLDMTAHFMNIYKIKKPEEFEKIAYFLINIFEKHDVGKSVSLDKALPLITQIIQEQKINNDADYKQAEAVSKASQKSIVKGYDYFEHKLQEFKSKIDSDIDELEIRNFIFENIWILDFKYHGYDRYKEEITDIGNIDISLCKNQLGIDSVVVAEFKRPDEPIVTINDRGEDKPAILSKVGRALSQTIHYMETKKKEYRHVEGIVIIGRRKELKDYFILNFNEYLHGIKVVTFDELHQNAIDVISVFKHYTS
ncbi:MAG TPA: hypothetical protein VFA69_06120 [Candidatus Nitrosotalea sp.]|nr:hypothetical protein [Candidatus Nitrosotalea sp.]